MKIKTTTTSHLRKLSEEANPVCRDGIFSARPWDTLTGWPIHPFSSLALSEGVMNVGAICIWRGLYLKIDLWWGKNFNQNIILLWHSIKILFVKIGIQLTTCFKTTCFWIKPHVQTCIWRTFSFTFLNREVSLAHKFWAIFIFWIRNEFSSF